MPLDTSGLRPLDATGLTPVTRDAPRLDAGGLIPLDTSGLKPLGPPSGGQPFGNEQPRAGIMETAGLIGGQLVDAVTHHVPGAIAAAIEGDDPYAAHDWKDALIERSRAKAKERAAEIGKGPTMLPGIGREDIAQLGPSAAFSAPAMAAGLGAGVAVGGATALTPAAPAAPAAGWTAGTVAAGATAYRMATNQFVRDLRDSVDAERAKSGIPPQTDAEFQSKASELAPLIREYGLWEAIPEAAGEAAGFGIIKAPIKGAIGHLFGNNVLTRLTTKAGALYGTELGTETITQQGQQNVENAAGMHPGEPDRSWTSPSDLYTSFKEVAPVTALQTTLMAGGVKLAGMRGGHAQPAAGDQSAVPAETIIPAPEGAPASNGGVNPVSGPAAPSQPVSPAPIAPPVPEGASPIEQTLQGANAGVSTAGVNPAAAQPLDTSGLTPVQTVANPTLPPNGLPPSNEAAKTDMPPGEPSGRHQLQALLDDPRSADEIRADMEAARNFKPTTEWQALPDDLDQTTLPPGLDGRSEADGRTYVRIPPPAGSREAPIELQTPADVHAGAEQTAQPTPAQAKAGNYQKRHIEWNGLDISIETEAGQQRVGISADGTPWSTTLQHPYGYIKETEGRDGDHLDLYIGPNPSSDRVYVVDQVDPDTRKFDEHKIVVGANTMDEATSIYRAGFSDGSADHRIGGIAEMSVPEFKAWLDTGNTKKPLVHTNPRAEPKRKVLSLFEFLASIGGIKDHGGELAHMGLDRHFIPGFGRLVRPNGENLDTAREAAAEMGYLPDQNGTTRDLLDLLAQEAGGQRIYSTPDVQAAQDRERKRGERADNERLDAAKDDARDIAKAEGWNASDADIEEAAKASLVNGTDLSVELFGILERNAVAHENHLADIQAVEGVDDERHAQRTGTDQAGAKSSQASEQPARPHPAAAPGGAAALGEPGGAERQPGAAPAVGPAATAADAGQPAGNERQPREGIDAVAIRDPQTGRVWAKKATVHSDLVEEAAKELGIPADELGDRIEYGFKTTTGRYVDRAEASKLVGATELHATELNWSKQELKDAEAPAGLVERIPGEDGTEVLIVKNSDGKRFNVVFRDTDAQETAGGIQIVASLEQARRAAHKMLHGPQAEGDRSNFEIDPATRVKTEQEAQQHGGQYTAVARRLKPWAAERGYGDTPLSAQNDALRRLKTAFRLTEPVDLKVNTPKPAAPRTPSVPTKTSEQTETTPEAGPLSNLPAVDLANDLLKRLIQGKPITAQILQQEAAKAYGAKLSEGKFNRKDIQDVLELAVNLYIKETRHLRVDSPNPIHAIKMLDDVLAGLPTQRVRSEEQDSFQQFSTPPNYAAAAVYAANLRDGDVMLEPSAGTGSLIAAASAPGVRFIANELSERRAALLRMLVGARGQVFNENAEQLDNILPDDVKPTVVVMNPPFSRAAGRMGDRKMPLTAAEHIEAALNLLPPGGRLVAIVQQGMTMGAPTFRAWWSKIGKENTIAANIGVAGGAFEKYGTSFGSRLIVIDKTRPDSGHKPVLVEAQTVDDLMRALEPIRDGRSEPAQSSAAQPSSAGATEGSQGGRAGALPASVGPGSVGPGEESAGGVSGSRSGGAEGASGPSVRVEAGEHAGVAVQQSERPGPGRAASGAAEQPGAGAQPESGRRIAPQRDLQSAASGQPGAAASSERAELETAQAKPASQGATAIDESLYQSYEPQRVRVKGAKPHPGPLVESASMSSVSPPNVTYAPHIPSKVIEQGKLSLAQLEPVVYAGQAHSKMLPAAEGETPKRRGYFIGDGTGVGKGREIAGVILDNFQQGRTKAVWVSEKQTLIEDAKRDWGGLGQDQNAIFNAGKVKTGEPIKAGKGIAFITYDTLKGGLSDQEAIARGQFVRKQKVRVNGQSGTIQKIAPVAKGTRGNVSVSTDITVKLDNGTEVTVPHTSVFALGNAQVKSRVDQLVDWLGTDFDGVIAYDEAHNMGNAVTTKGERGAKEAAAKAIAGISLQDRLPNARVVYVSATGATEVSNLAYANRLGLWGRGTPFASQAQFVSDVGEGGIAAMELVARDMKQLGLYTARNLSYDGVEYNRVEHTLDNNQREIYDTLAEAWQGVLRNINNALQETGGNKDGRAKAAAMSAFWGGHQRFFNQIITSLQMPSVIKAVEKDIAAGHQVVLQLTNTNEASQERAAAKATTAEEIEDLDITPRDQIIQLVEKSFPTQEYEQYMDGDKVKSRPVVDGKGEPVQNKKAVAMREALIERLGSIRVPQGPLDMVLDQFGHETVAEVTGRGRRFILKTDDKSGERKRVEDARGGSANLAETDAFQSGKKKILVFSEAGGTGRSYHADNTSPSKGARRVHYLVQGGWRADKAVQGFGRTHRTNQASAPIFRLVTTDLKGQKRFISSIARRLAQLGALTKGQRQAGDQGVFSARDNLESTEARQALQQFYSALLRDELDGITINEFENQTGLALRTKDDEGRVTGVKLELPPITTFLNRLLSLKVDLQNRVFDAFSEKLDAVIEGRREAGLLDVGLETVKADKIEKDTEKVVHSIEGTDANTKYVKFTLSNRFKPRQFDDVANDKGRPPEFFAKSPRGKVYAVAKATSLTNKDGVIVDYYRLIGPGGSHTIEKKNVDTGKDWSKINRGQAQTMWADEIKKSPEYVTEPLHLITGAILPIWDRLGGSARVVRLQDNTGEQYIGRVVPSGAISSTLKKLGAEGEAPKLTPASLYEAVMKGGRATLSNGWTLKRSRVAQENRIELLGPSSFSEGNEVKADGVFTERIDYKVRYFVPADETSGAATLAKLTKFRTVVELNEGGAKPGEAAGAEDSMFSLGHDTPTFKTGTGTEMRVPFTPKFAEHAEAIYPLLRAELDRLGLKNVGLKLADEIRLWKDGKTGTAAGVYYKSIITLALNGERKFAILHHEALHGLRRLGTFTEGEWSILTRASNNTWRKQFQIEHRYQGWPEWVKEEEGIANAYEAWAEGKLKVEGRIARLFKRVRDTIEAIGNAFRGEGFKSAESIFRDINSGKIGTRNETGKKLSGEVAYAVNSGDGDLFKTEIVQTPDGPREQGVIPGAEKISEKERLERKGKEPKRGTRPQKSVDGLPLFEGEPSPELPLFALKTEPTTAVQRQNVMQGFLARGQYLDRAIRMPFDFFGGVTRDGQWKFGAKLFDKASNIITGAKFSVEGRFAFANPFLEAARAGLVDRYGLEPAYVERERARALDERAVMLQGAEVLKSLKAHSVGPAESRVLQAILTGEDVTDNDMRALAEPIRAAVDQLGQEAVALGLVSGESFERNRGTYLHRVYKKYEAEQNGLVRTVNNIMGSRRKKIIGDQFRGRGLFQDVALSRLMRDVPDWHEGAKGKPEIGEKFIRLDEMPSQAQLELDDKASPEKALRTVYWPADQAIPDKYSGFTDQGTWEVRGSKDGKLTIWRDFTKDERTKMGEILDARYTIGKTFMLMAHDLSVGKFYKDIAENEQWASSQPPAGRTLDAGEWSAQRQRYWKHGDVEWVKVPSAEIPNSGGKLKWGALSGKYVREEIWRDLNEQEIMNRPSTWRTLLQQWKLNKTARSPVVHMNNVMSNFMLMDLLDVRFQDLAQGIRSYVSGDAHYEEAFKHGAFGADMISQEVRKNVLQPVLEEIMRDNTFQQGGHLGALGQVSKFTELLYSTYQRFDKTMRDAYSVEDELFRMATYIRRRALGDTPRQAADHAREQFIDYDIRAPWVNAARNTVLPFISYTYRAIPLVARAIATRPWKLGKYFALAYVANALAYALSGGDEDRERRSLREQEQGKTWVGVQRMMRMPVNDSYGNPIFLDVRRWMPAGDVFDMNQGQLATPIVPSWLIPGGPLMLGAELALNRTAFTGEDIVNKKTDDALDIAGKVADWAWKSWMPSAAWVPGSWYWEKIENAVKGATDRQGRPYSVPLALSSSVGVKLKPQDVDDAMSFKAYEFEQVEKALKLEMTRASSRHERGMISDSTYNKQVQKLLDKMQRAGEKAAETLK